MPTPEFITVESCLAEFHAELRRIAPLHQASTDFTSTDSLIGFAPQQARKIITRVAIRLYPIIKSVAFTKFEGDSIEVCMAQVRAWKESQE